MTYSKIELKRMFLLSLDKSLSPNSRRTHGADGIISTFIEEDFKMVLTPEERRLVKIGYEELKREGIIIKDPDQIHDVFNIFTDDGKEVLEKMKKGGFDFNLSRIRLNDTIHNKSLRDVCRNSFDSSDYWDSILVGSRHIEIKIRELCELEPACIGTDLINKAFHPQKGMFKIIGCATPAEEEGIHSIMRGMTLYHRNAKGHREGDMNRTTAMKILGYLDYILSLVKTAERRT